MTLDESVCSLIGEIYTSMSEPAPWRAVLDRILTLTGSRFLLVSAVDLRGQRFSRAEFYGADDARFLNSVAEHGAELHHRDPMLAFARHNPLAGSISMSAAVTVAGDTGSHSYRRWYHSELRASDGTVRYTLPRDELTLGLSIHAPLERDGHSESDLGLFALLFSHIDAALRLAARPPDLTSGSDPLFLLDARCTVRRMNAAADSLLATNDGLAIRGRRLAAADPAAATRLDRLLASSLDAARSGHAGGALALPRRSGRPLLLWITPVPRPLPPLDAFCPAVLLRVVDQSMPPDSADGWRRMFGLSATEARLAAALVEAEGGLRGAAGRLSMNYGIARLHLAHISKRLGCMVKPSWHGCSAACPDGSRNRIRAPYSPASAIWFR